VRGDDGARGVEVGRIGLDDFVRGRLEQPGHREQQERRRGADRSAQEPRRLRARFELPPELVRIVRA
jgi:hypothetical protein